MRPPWRRFDSDEDADNEELVNEGTYVLTLEEIKVATSCAGVFTPGGDCSVHEVEEEAPPPRPVNVVHPTNTPEQRHEKQLRDCEDTWDETLPECHPASMAVDETATWCLIGEPIVCTDDAGTADITNWPGKALWTTREIKDAQSCDGELRLDGCPLYDQPHDPEDQPWK